ncbi:hypothetical protein [Treponema zioleckii]|uniref:hypothetical protein n=1 Tax=Treponema zioleckii TaxID=331680 RepID=UPI00168A762A|nr:hypothetical protein [Treponema zioleckii]
MKKWAFAFLTLLFVFGLIFVSCHADVNDMVTNVKVTYTNGNYIVTWDPVDGASAYKVYKITESTSTSTTGTSTSTSTTYNLNLYRVVNETFLTIPRSSSTVYYDYCIGALVDGKETFLSEKFSLR